MKLQRKTRAPRIAMLAAAGVLGATAFALFGMPGHDPSGPPQKDMDVDKATRNEVIDRVIASLDRAYVFPEQAALMGKSLRAQRQRGDFDRVTSAEKFAGTLTDALQRDSHDRHLEVRYVADPIPLKTDKDDSPVDKAAELAEESRFNFGFNGVDRLQGDIGYIDLHAFSRPQGVAPRLVAAMALMSDTKALIVDLRHCDGGDPESVMLVASYFYDQPTHLNDVYWRDENRTERRWTQASVAGLRYGQSRKLYLLTSGDTFSGCEDFAYALKNNHRATLIGETTGGGAHAGSPQRLDAHFMMFVPTGRPISPVTQTDWEGTGVVPDVPVAARKALDAAQVAALKALIPVEPDREWKQKLQQRLHELD